VNNPLKIIDPRKNARFGAHALLSVKASPES